MFYLSCRGRRAFDRARPGHSGGGVTTEDFEGVELLASGVRIHGHGSAPEGQVLSERDLEAIASANRELADEILVPLKIGHSPEQRLLHASGSRREVANRRRDRVGKARRDRRSADRRRRRARWQLHLFRSVGGKEVGRSANAVCSALTSELSGAARQARDESDESRPEQRSLLVPTSL